MCLEKAIQIKPEKDIICYKICVFAENRFFSPFYYFPYLLGKVEKIGKMGPEIYSSYSADSEMVAIQGDSFHSFKTLRGAKGALEIIKKKSGTSTTTNYVILKCVIPKDSKYVYEGLYYPDTDNKKYVSYASQQIMQIEALTSYYSISVDK